MIKDPPVLRIRRRFTRPPAGVLEAFAGAQTGHVVDAMGGKGALPARIKPLLDAGTTVGVAVTSHSRPGDNLGLFASLDVVRPGDVLVAASDGFLETAITGDLLVGMAKNLGAVGLVTVPRELGGCAPLRHPTPVRPAVRAPQPSATRPVPDTPAGTGRGLGPDRTGHHPHARSGPG